MNDNTKQKKLARERQARTGEPYVTALAHVRAEALAKQQPGRYAYTTRRADEDSA
jgi:hypothetical protein